MKFKKVLGLLLLCGAMILCFAACAVDDKPKNEEQDVQEIEESGKDYDLKQEISTHKALIATTEIVDKIEIPAGVDIIQGGYTDGRYFYQGFIKRDEASGELENEDIVVKYDMESDVIAKQSAKLKLNHCNDITYNSKLDKFFVCNATPRKNIVSILNPETLELEGEINLSFDIFSISYNESRDQYVVGIAGGQTFRLLDADFEIASDIYDPTTRTIGYTTQGNTCDDDYIYFILYKENVITVYDWDGKFVSWIKLDIPNTVEPENISVIGNDIYIGASGAGHEIYKIKTLKPEE